MIAGYVSKPIRVKQLARPPSMMRMDRRANPCMCFIQNVWPG